MIKKFCVMFFGFTFTTLVLADWPTFNGNLANQKYTPLTQINPSNVKQLTAVWRIHTGDVSDGRGKIAPTAWSATPIFANNTLYLGTPFYRILALDPATGKIKWQFNTHTPITKPLRGVALKTRGVAYWQASHIVSKKPCQKRVYLGTVDAKLYAVDADNGKLCQDFGHRGMVDFNQWDPKPKRWAISLLQPPTVFKNLLFIGWAAKDWGDASYLPGRVYALNARSGKVVWVFQPVPQALASKTGTANVWASMALDKQKGILYVPVASPSPNFWGGHRLAKMPYATSITALDAYTGKVIWSRQLVHHDIWDYDVSAPPSLVDLHKNGRIIPALVQTTKQGFLFVLNRYTGAPIYPIIERAVPKSTAEGEVAAPTQPFVPYPEPTNDTLPKISKLADWVSLGYCSRLRAKLTYQGRFTPPSTQGTLNYPGTGGEVEWGGGAVEPRQQIFVVNNSTLVQIQKLIPRAQYQQLKAAGKLQELGGIHSMHGAPYALQLKIFLNPLGMPCWAPPYGLISAYDLNTGELLWRKPFGQVQKYGFYMPKSWGSITVGAPVITASGLIFIGGSMDSRVRALDLHTGKTLWQAQMSAPSVAIPAVYQYKGKEYVTFVAGGNSILVPKVSDEVATFALPSN